MDVENINKQIQTEKDSYNRAKNRLQQKLLTLKQRHQRRLSDLQKQKEHVVKQQNEVLMYVNKVIEQALKDYE